MFYQPDADGDEGEEGQEQYSTGGRDGLIFVIDANEDMFDEHESKPALFRKCLECIESTMMNMIISSERDNLAILFYNTKNCPKPRNETEEEKTKWFSNFKNCAVFISMRTISKELIQQVRNLKESDDLEDFSTVYGHSTQPVNMSEVLWVCSKLITTCDYNMQTSTIILFTNRDQPHPKNSTEFLQAFKRAKDLSKFSLAFDVIPMSQDFVHDHFYKDLVSTITQDDPESYVAYSMTQAVENLMLRKFRKDYRKKCNRHLKMSIGDGILFGVALYNLTGKVKLPKRLKLFRESNEVLVSKRSYIIGAYDEELNEYNYSRAEKLMPSQIRKSQQLGGEKITFTADEVSSMKQLMEPGIRLLGFKPKSKISLHQYLTSADFLFYDESLITGSATLFRGLWEKCLAKDKVAICAMASRRKVAAKYVALIPQTDVIENDSGILRRNGFRVIYLPCEVHIRNLDVFNETGEDSEPIPEGVVLFEKVVNKLKFRYKPEMFENSTLKSLYSHIEAIAYDTENIAEFEDSTLPDVENQNGKVGQFVEHITEIFGDVSLESRAEKRGTSAQGDQATKTRRTMGTGENLDPVEIETAFKNGTLDKLSVAVLKNYLTTVVGERGLSKIVKAGLIEKIKTHLG